MPISNFGNGFIHGVTIRGVPILQTHAGKAFFVNNSTVVPPGGVGGSDTNPGTYQKPFSTIQNAINNCVANRGDIVLISPGHVEAVTATSLLLNKAGVAILGLGDGDLIPKLNFGATSSNIAISAANVSLQNVNLVATIDAVVAGITISAAGCTLDIASHDTSSAIGFISPIVTTAAADNVVCCWRHRGFAAGSTMTRGIDLVGCQDALIDCDFFGNASVAVVNMRTTACDNIRVTGNFYNDAASLTKNVVNSTTSTWSVNGYDGRAGSRFSGSTNLTITAANGTSLPQAFASTAKVLGTGNTTLFTIAGGPIQVLGIYGIVTTVVQAQATSCKLQAVTTSPSATVDISAAAVDLTGAAAGASIRHINTTAILTVVIAGYVMEGNAFATNDTQLFVPAGSIQLNNASAANTGAITWYLRYVPLSSACVVS